MSVGIALMQGRLLPPVRHPIQEFPVERWAEEFAQAAALGFDAIEFIFGGPAIERHPLLEPECRAIRACTHASGMAVRTVCADYFMEHPLHGVSAAEAAAAETLLRQLLAQAAMLGVTDVVLPCVDAATVATPQQRQELVRALRALAPSCARHRVRLALELDVPPGEVRELIMACDSLWVRVNYDAGNSAALGYDVTQEWAVYGDLVSSVHLKDRLRGGSTVSLGRGAVDFDRLFQALRAQRYAGLLTIQGARGVDHAATAQAYLVFVRDYVKRYLEPALHGSVAA